LRGC